MNCYTHWRDRELMSEPPWWNDCDDEDCPDPDLAWKERDLYETEEEEDKR